MSEHNVVVSLRHMLDAAREAMAYAERHTRDEAESDPLRWRGLIKLLEIVGEAASRIPMNVRSRHPGIPRSSVVGMRNRLIHGYDRVDNAIAWNVLKVELPRIVKEIERAIEEETP